MTQRSSLVTSFSDPGSFDSTDAEQVHGSIEDGVDATESNDCDHNFANGASACCIYCGRLWNARRP